MKKILDHFRKNWIQYGFEVLVVIVGILIAFRLSGWNENRKSRNLENKFKRELYYSIKNDIPYLESRAQEYESVQQSCQAILDHFDQDLGYHDSLTYYFANVNHWWYTSIKTSAYEATKSYGLYFFEDDSIRLKLATAYEINLHFMQTSLEQRQKDYYNVNVVPVLMDHFDKSVYGPFGSFQMIPNDYERLKEDSRYLNILRTNIAMRDVDIYAINYLRDQLIDINTRLERELK